MSDFEGTGERILERNTESDEELRKILENRKAEIKVCGVGGRMCRRQPGYRDCILYNPGSGKTLL